MNSIYLIYYNGDHEIYLKNYIFLYEDFLEKEKFVASFEKNDILKNLNTFYNKNIEISGKILKWVLDNIFVKDLEKLNSSSIYNFRNEEIIISTIEKSLQYDKGLIFF